LLACNALFISSCCCSSVQKILKQFYDQFYEPLQEENATSYEEYETGENESGAVEESEKVWDWFISISLLLF